jgi:predicted RNA-binding Zn-ribbon protein involved in translation (DUF1610 family)
MNSDDKKQREKYIIKLYVEDNESCMNISKIVSIQRKNVYQILKRNNIALREKVFSKCSICEKEISNQKGNRRRCGTCDTKVRRYRARLFAVNYLGGKCEHCGWNGDISGFDFHHEDPSKKEFTINALTIANKKWDVVKKELDKCKLLCVLCHRLEHSDYQNIKLIEEAKTYAGIIFKK